MCTQLASRGTATQWFLSPCTFSSSPNFQKARKVKRVSTNTTLDICSGIIEITQITIRTQDGALKSDANCCAEKLISFQTSTSNVNATKNFVLNVAITRITTPQVAKSSRTGSKKKPTNQVATTGC